MTFTVLILGQRGHRAGQVCTRLIESFGVPVKVLCESPEIHSKYEFAKVKHDTFDEEEWTDFFEGQKPPCKEQWTIVLDTLSIRTWKSPIIRMLMHNARHLRCNVIIHQMYIVDFPVRFRGSIDRLIVHDIGLPMEINHLKRYYFDEIDEWISDATIHNRSALDINLRTHVCSVMELPAPTVDVKHERKICCGYCKCPTVCMVCTFGKECPVCKIPLPRTLPVSITIPPPPAPEETITNHIRSTVESILSTLNDREWNHVLQFLLQYRLQTH